MKKIYYLAALPLAIAAGLTSCIQDEALNTECDIESCTLPDSTILASAVVIDNETVTIRIKPDADISALAPIFTITEGATISPESGSVHDFLNAEKHTIEYTVTSQDGEWSKTYPVRVLQKEVPSEFFFNSNRLDSKDSKYTIFREKDEEGEIVMEWASGNPGFVMCGVADKNAKAEHGDSYKDFIWQYFPTVGVYDATVQIIPNESEGYKYFSDAPKFIRLTTCSTGSFGAMVKMPIAAGNIFQGVFDLSNAIAKPREATKFGEPYRYEPATLSGEYRYKRGEKFTDKSGKVVAGRQDIFSIYALFYESEPGVVDYLDVEIHKADFKPPNLVSIAIVKDPKVTGLEEGDWVKFEIPFERVEGKEIDREKLVKGQYKIGMVLSSSEWGDYFEGAVGSTLDIRNLKYTNVTIEE